MNVTTVCLISDDPITESGATRFLGRWREISILPQQESGNADVILALLLSLTEAELARVRRAVAGSRNPAARIVIVADEITESHLAYSAARVPLRVLVRSRTTFAQIRNAVIDTAAHRALVTVGAEPPPLRAGEGALPRIPPPRGCEGVLREVLPPPANPLGGFLPREIEVLRLLALGLNTDEIAASLNFSQRTIKAVIHDMLARLGLRNRQHAVAHALRINAL
ncbi:helix-turn-helix transcriptional regulator [Streptomyces sp.]|uniref:helix-turn-helix transcriptional regulator n=1 Tax=Streptomyces sp. TaxID=1931 RepID=UPI002F409806